MTTTPDRRRVMQASLLAAAFAPLGSAQPARASAASKKPGSGDPLHDFDFLVGSWHVAHRRLKGRLVGSKKWEEFEGSCVMRQLLGGYGNVDDNVINLPGGVYRGVGLRSYNAEDRTWAIWWLDARNPHKIDIPVIGGFKDGVGTFYSDDTHNDIPVRVRFRWLNIKANSCDWDQAFSTDGEKTWETNWVMHFTRTA